jgi:hypothetical protein
MICITFDTDWMSNEAMSEFLDRISWPGSGTFFLHQNLPALYETRHELCPHPLIEDLGTWTNGLKELESVVPNISNGVRPHSCVFSHMIGLELSKQGYSYVSQASHLYEVGLKAHRHPWGLWELPIYYMDNMDICMVDNWPSLGHKPFASKIIDQAINEPGLYVFDFHPIHLALNTKTHLDYSSVKDKIVSGKASPFEFRTTGRGAAVFFDELCDAMTKANVESISCSQALSGMD